MDETAMRRAIAVKRDGAPLDARTWRAIVEGHGAGRIDDAQVAALLMACVLRGTTAEETFALTSAFVDSGETLAPPDARTVDKHSTGGVGDTASLVVVPLVAACGIPVAKLSGRALGHTGGTLDKLEAIDGVRTDLEPERFFACVASEGCAIAAQSARLVPADKRIYALRDRTATVPAPGLIAASIVSKKIAGGAHAIVFDVKAGAGAFLPVVNEARALALMLVDLSRAFGRRATALVTDMNEPLGPAIGTGLEAREARDFLSGARRDPRLAAVSFALASELLEAAGERGDHRMRLDAVLASGHAYERFERMLAAQGAAPGALERLQPHAISCAVRATRGGTVTAIDPVALGEATRALVALAGPFAGIVVRARIGDPVGSGDELALVYGGAATPEVAAAFTIGDGPVARRAVIYGAVGSDSRATEARSTLESKYSGRALTSS